MLPVRIRGVIVHVHRRRCETGPVVDTGHKTGYEVADGQLANLLCSYVGETIILVDVDGFRNLVGVVNA